MAYRRDPPLLDMTPDGAFRDPLPRVPTGTDRLLARVGGVAVLVGLVATGLLVASFAAIVIGLLLPVALGAVLVAAGTLWWRARRARARGEPLPPLRFVIRRR